MKLILLALTIVAVSCTMKVHHHQSEQYGGISIIKAERVTMLNGAYPEEVNKVTVSNPSEGSIQHFYHVVPAEIAKTLAEVKFEIKRVQQKHTVKQTADGAFIYQVEFADPLTNGADKILTITTRYINRYRNLPALIGLLDDQYLEYSDNVNYYSPYEVDVQSSLYKFQKMMEHTNGGEKEGLTAVKYSSVATKPWNTTKVTVHGINNEPQVLFTSVSRMVEVSHWGNIAITEKYSILNVGPGIKGEFSRVEFNQYNDQAGKATFKSIQTTLPYEAWGLYYRDQVGNISTSRAYRDSKNVVAAFTPRFALFGGWRCNWQIGYNLPLKGFLYHDGDNFELRTVTFGYELQRIIAQKFTFTIVLPEGATDYHIFMGEEQIPFVESKTFWFLDYSGKPTLTVERGITSKSMHKSIKVSYKFSKKSILKKPFVVFSAIFALLVGIILAKRINLKTLSKEHF